MLAEEYPHSRANLVQEQVAEGVDQQVPGDGVAAVGQEIPIAAPAAVGAAQRVDVRMIGDPLAPCGDLSFLELQEDALAAALDSRHPPGLPH